MIGGSQHIWDLFHAETRRRGERHFFSPRPPRLRVKTVLNDKHVYAERAMTNV
jgi:hypothetical protein